MKRSHRISWVMGFAVSLAIGSPFATSAAEGTEKVNLGTAALTSGIPGKGPLKLAEIKKWLANESNHRVLDVELPFGLATGANQMQGLKENPLTRAGIELGRQLYFDTRLSVDNTVSCASCHHPDEGYARHTQFGVGIKGLEGGRNSPVSYNRILSGAQFWDGRADSLEAQAIGPIANPIEMGNTHAAAVKTLKQIPGYVEQFAAVYPGKDPVNIENVGKAIASFERAIVTGPSPFDYAEAIKPFTKLSADDLADLKDDAPETYAKYEDLKKQMAAHPLSESAKRGMSLYFSEAAGCATCHVGANLADERYHNLGIGMLAKQPDPGRFAVTKNPKDMGAFKTPTIRNVALTAPYMHDGSLKTLEDVVEHYAKGGIPNPTLSDKIKKLTLTAQDKKDLVEFMKACTGEFPKVEQGRLPE